MINTTRQEVIDFLLSLGLSPLPVAPAQSADKYPLSFENKEGIWEPSLDKEGNKKPRFTGKNPSYLDERGIPRLVKHQDTPTSKEQIDTWFQDARTGIGAYGSDEIIWLDIDKKQFESEEDCTNRFNALLEKYPQLKSTWLEQTQAGGYRIAVKVKTKPTFTNFSLDGIGGKHHGEALGKGRFTVLAPTIGVSGKPYVCLNRAIPVEVESLESIGIYPVRKEADKKQSREDKQNQTNFDFNFGKGKYSDEVSLHHLISAKAQALTQNSSSLDRSFDFTSICKEIFGWYEWLNKRSIGVIEDTKKLLFDIGASIGLDYRRIEKIISSINPSDCVPSIFFISKDLGCWEKIKKAHKDVFNKLCPDVIKEALKSVVKHSSVMPNGIEFTSNKYFNYEHLDAWVKFKEYTPTETQNTPDIDLSGIPQDNVIVGVKAGMGVGKTQASLLLIKPMDNQNVCWMSSRIKLLFQTIERASEEDIKMYLVNEEDGLDALLRDNKNLAFCGESAHKLDGFYKGKTLIIDETGSSFKQLLSGGTVSESRQALTLRVIRRFVNESARVIVMDANLSDEILALLSSFAPDKKVIKIENTYTRGSAKITIVQATQLMADGSYEVCKKDKSPLVKLLLDAKEGAKLAIPCDSKRSCDNIEKLLFDNNKWGFNLNRETSEQTWGELFNKHPEVKEALKKIAVVTVDWTKKWSDEFLSSPSSFLLRLKPDFVVYSPTAESGVSITCKYFTKIIALFCGVLDTNAQTQMLFRVRDLEIPRYVFCPESGIRTDTTYSSASSITEAFKAALALTLKGYSRCPSTKELFRLAEERIDTDWADYAIKLEVCEDFEKSNLRSCLIFQLKSMGHFPEIIEELKDDEINEITKAINAELLEQEAEEIFNAEPFEDLKIAQEAIKKNSSLQVKRRYDKTKIITYLPDIEKEDIWSTDFILETFVKDRHCLSQHQKYWLLLNPEADEQINDFWHYTKASKEFVTTWMLTNEQQVILKGLRKLGIDTLIKKLEKGFIFTNKTPEIQELLNRARKDKDLKRIKQFQPSKATIKGIEILPFIRSLLALVGVQIEQKEKARGEDGIQYRWYGLNVKKHSDPYRVAMINAIEKERKSWLETKYLKPDWDYLKETGKLPAEFNERSDNEEGEHQISFEESKGESKISFHVDGVGQVNYTYPDMYILIIVRKYAKYLKGELDLTDINYSKEAVDKAVQVHADCERYPCIREDLAPLFI
ncbi:MAG: bifunctional DNA primase/polymerase [Spirirestis rafaelensis WJT71-NPBG6]|jgi:hypothetical protein|nr:bifunctional DNA primase/polymerase [Spirirestis rafaelensis WJT71-NPBG6]